jgi:membrane protease YdiL (CAAX protease family)
MHFLLNFLITLTFLTLVTASLWLWGHVYSRWRAGKPILDPLVPLPWVEWGLIDLFGLMLLLVGLQVAAAYIIGQLPLPEQVVRLEELKSLPSNGGAVDLDAMGEPESKIFQDPPYDQGEGLNGASLLDKTPARQERLLLSMVMANFGWVLLSLLGMKYLRGLSLRDLGFDRERFRDDIRLGFATFCLLAPVVYGLQLILVQLWPSQHPIVDMIREDESGRLLWLGGITAIVAAPLFEELAFRLFLQGWLENVVRVVYRQSLPSDQGLDEPHTAPGDRYWEVIVQGWRPTAADNSTRVDMAAVTDSAPREFRSRDVGMPSSGGDRSVSGLSGADELGPADDRDGVRGEPQFLAAPIGISALIFALLHYNHGPDWIPLLILAIGLGYLYQRTRRILPCILVHLLLNATSFGMLLVELCSGK